ncbi:Asparagine--tRNA ligase [Hypsizygus marmoreus]|uniref:asparagine--tRNA ligase n=1 Tax=Hypsizygus marmoreus TaxID=39966 RepID=A0A369JGN3_HYPMA|nr:Asparagine--tRNA ligase [Hypsizygus marmoreus]
MSFKSRSRRRLRVFRTKPCGSICSPGQRQIPSDRIPVTPIPKFSISEVHLPYVQANMILRRFASSVASFKLPPTICQLLAGPTLPEPPTITVSGWIKSIRRQKNVAFAVVSDGSSATGLQAVFTGNGEGIKGLTNGAAVRLTGKLVPSPGAGQEKELLVDLGKPGEASEGKAKGNLQVLGSCDPEAYPIQKQALSTEYLRDHSHLRARTDHIASMIRLRDALKRNIGTFFDEQGFCYTHTPVLTGNDAEGAGEAFKIAPISSEHPAAHASSAVPQLSTSSPSTSSHPHRPAHDVEFFSRPAYLTVSHQLHLESLATALSRVYTLSPCFRAEPSLTKRHLAEFWMLEAEWAFGSENNSIEDVCALVEAGLRQVVGGIVASPDTHMLWKGGDEAKHRALVDAVAPSTKPWTRISYTDAVKALETALPFAGFEYEPGWGAQLQSEHERWIAETFVGGPVFITDYPAALKPFYMRLNDSPTTDAKATVACFDLIIPHVGELAGGSVREERLPMLEARMREGLGGDLDAYRWYADLRRFGGAPHAGFGMGFERLVGWVGGMENVRECVPFPRWAGRMLL